MRDDKKGL